MSVMKSVCAILLILRPSIVTTISSTSFSSRFDVILDDVLTMFKNCASGDFGVCLTQRLILDMDHMLNQKTIVLDGNVTFDSSKELKQNGSNTTKLITFSGRTSYNGGDLNLDEVMIMKILDFFKSRTLNIPLAGEIDSRQVLRTFRRARRYFLPLLIGVIMKLAAFLPLQLSVLFFMAKTSFFSGTLSFFLSIATIVYNYLYNKKESFAWALGSSNSYPEHGPELYSHIPPYHSNYMYGQSASSSGPPSYSKPPAEPPKYR